MLMYLHKAPHRSWLMAERHLKEYTQKSFPEPTTLFDTHEEMPAAKAAEMKINGNMAWAGDSKVSPEVMDELGLKEIGFDKVRYKTEVGRLNPEQKLVTIYHLDYPFALVKKGGWGNPQMVDWYVNYATIVLQRYGKKVKKY